MSNTDYMPVYNDQSFPMTASATITAGQLVKVSGVKTVAPTAANTDRAIGVAGNAAANGQQVTVWPLPGVMHESTNSNAGTITAGNPITAGATGGVDTGTLATVAAAGTLIGVAVTTAATAAIVRWIGV